MGLREWWRRQLERPLAAAREGLIQVPERLPLMSSAQPMLPGWSYELTRQGTDEHASNFDILHELALAHSIWAMAASRVPRTWAELVVANSDDLFSIGTVVTTHVEPASDGQPRILLQAVGRLRILRQLAPPPRRMAQVEVCADDQGFGLPTRDLVRLRVVGKQFVESHPVLRGSNLTTELEPGRLADVIIGQSVSSVEALQVALECFSIPERVRQALALHPRPA